MEDRKYTVEYTDDELNGNENNSFENGIKRINQPKPKIVLNFQWVDESGVDSATKLLCLF